MMNARVLRVLLIGALACGPAWAEIDAANEEDAPVDLFMPSESPVDVEETPARTADTLDTIPVQATPAAPPMGRDDAGAAVQLEEITVTATKRAASPRELPSSISAVRGQDLEKIGAQGQEDFLKMVPGVTFVNDQITPNRITIRGIGADLNTSNTTGVFLGDVPFEDPTLPRLTLDPNPFDLARVEVLKGPQGTLFGGSALNGAVRYIPEDPSLAGWEGKAYMQVENVYEGGLGTGYGAALNIPLGDSFALRAVGFDRHSSGWVDDLGRDLEDVNELDQQGGRLMSLWQPNESWKISAMVVAQQTEVADSSITDNRDGNLSRSNTPAASPVRSKYDLETLGIQYSFDSFDVQSQTSRAAKTFNGRVDASRIGNIPNPPPLVTIYNDNESEALMQELRFTSNDGANPDWKWLGGVFYRKVLMREVSDILASNQPLPIPPALLDVLAGLIPGFNGIITEDGRINTARGEADPIDVREAALFGEITSTFWNDFEVTLGLRAFRNTSDSRVIFSGALAANLSEPTTERVVEGRIVESGVNPKLALKYSFNEHVAIYAAASRGFRFGGAQVLVGTLTSQAPDFYKSDTLWAYEAGLRTQWLENTLFADITPFYATWKDPQLQQADGTGLGAYFDNVGGARTLGVELALRYLTPVPGLALSFTGSYVDTVTTEPFTTSDGTETQPGTRWPLAAEWQTATTLAYDREWFAGWGGGFSLLYATISSASNTLSYLDTVFGYQTLDASLNFGNPGIAGRPELSLTLSNATDERGIISGVNNPQFASDHNYIRPRTLIARIGLSF